MAVVDNVREALEQTVLDFTDRSGDWAGVLAMAQAGEGDRRGRAGAFRGSSRRRLVALAAVVLIVFVGTASALAVRAFIDKDIVGLPRVGATPSTPENGVLEMYYRVLVPRAGSGWSRTWVYADGRLIRLGALRDNGTPVPEAFNRWSVGFVEQRLTRDGVNRLRSEIVSAGGFGHAQPPPGSKSVHAGTLIQVRKGDRLVPLWWASDLERLMARLYDLELWLPASAWKQRKIRTYVPARFAVCATVSVSDNPGRHLQQMRPARIVALLPAAAQNVLRGRDWNTHESSGGCFDVTTNEARSLAKALEGAGPAKKGRLRYTFDAPGPSRQVLIGFSPYLPHGETTCLPCG